MTDWRGNPIEVGTLVVYPKVFGSRAQLVEARVIELGDGFIKVERLRASRYGTKWWTDRPSKLTILENVTVVSDD